MSEKPEEQPEMQPLGGALGAMGFQGYAEGEVIKGPGEPVPDVGHDEQE